MEFMRLGLQARGKQGSVTVHKVHLCPLVARILLQVLRAYREVSGLTVWMEMGKSSHCSKTMPVKSPRGPGTFPPAEGPCRALGGAATSSVILEQ